MPVIPEESIMDLEQFIDWDKADPAVGGSFDANPLSEAPAANDPDDLRLFFDNADGDDFSFWALEHYEQSNLNATTVPGDGILPGWELPGAPCANCQKAGYQCKTIPEGCYRGYCTSCVALRCQCSFGLTAADEHESATFPPNPWPTLGDHPNAIPHEDGNLAELSHGTSTPMPIPDVAGERVAGPMTAPKIGARFSRESAKILKNWISTHSRHPYPTDEEKESLQRLTGLNKTQIVNWLANARRRGKYQIPRSTSPHVKNWSGAIDIPPRRGTPGPGGSPLESMNPLQRWANSPPEHEPASVTDIARAITSSSAALSSGLNSPRSFNYTDDGSSRSLCLGSSASSVGTSGSSGGSFASAFSHASRGSFGSVGSFNRGRRRRRRRTAPKQPTDAPTSLAVPLKTFQCTFCT